VNFTATYIIAMLQLCTYETQALGYSAFCGLFSEEDFLNYEYYFDLVSLYQNLVPTRPNLHFKQHCNRFQSFYYNNGPGSPVSAAQGKGYLQVRIFPY
jgi:hypothetical protein